MLENVHTGGSLHLSVCRLYNASALLQKKRPLWRYQHCNSETRVHTKHRTAVPCAVV